MPLVNLKPVLREAKTKGYAVAAFNPVDYASMKAMVKAAEELNAGARASAELGGSAPDVRPSGLEALGEHRFVLVSKARPTPSRYPRRAGEPARRPLG